MKNTALQGLPLARPSDRGHVAGGKGGKSLRQPTEDSSPAVRRTLPVVLHSFHFHPLLLQKSLSRVPSESQYKSHDLQEPSGPQEATAVWCYTLGKRGTEQQTISSVLFGLPPRNLVEVVSWLKETMAARLSANRMHKLSHASKLLKLHNLKGLLRMCIQCGRCFFC